MRVPTKPNERRSASSPIRWPAGAVSVSNNGGNSSSGGAGSISPLFLILLVIARSGWLRERNKSTLKGEDGRGNRSRPPGYRVPAKTVYQRLDQQPEALAQV